MPCDMYREVSKTVRSLRRRPAASPGNPSWQREVIHRHDRGQSGGQACLGHPRVVIECGTRHVPGLWLDATPFQGESVGVATQLGEQRQILRIPVIVITRVTRGLLENRVLGPLQRPQVGADVAPLDLMAGRRRAPQESLRKSAPRHANQPTLLVLRLPQMPPSVWQISRVYAKLCTAVDQDKSDFHRPGWALAQPGRLRAEMDPPIVRSRSRRDLRKMATTRRSGPFVMKARTDAPSAR